MILIIAKTFVNWKWFVLNTGVIGPGAFPVAHVLTNPVPWTQSIVKRMILAFHKV